jgi:murein DD-endopeptidase MepM/ murein hydrolase activator NlpD
MEPGVIVVDLDGDGYEQTGWVILYLHVANDDHIRPGDWVDQGTRLGNPSCEGGNATGTHLHIARKYNGEWISAVGAIPFEMSGWVAQYGEPSFQGGDGGGLTGTLMRGDELVTACTCSNVGTRIALSTNDPY